MKTIKILSLAAVCIFSGNALRADVQPVPTSFKQTELGLSISGIWRYSPDPGRCLIQNRKLIVRFRCDGEDYTSAISQNIPGQEVSVIIQNSQVENIWLSPE